MSIAMEGALAERAEAHAGSVREVINLALPVVLTNLSATLMMTVDAAIVGHLGAAELGAVGYGGIWYWTALSLFSGTATGVQTFVSQAQGAGAERTCGAWAWQAFYAVVPLAVVGMTLFALAFGSFLHVLAPAAALQPLAASY